MSTLHTWDVWRSWPDVTIMSCRGCDHKLQVQTYKFGTQDYEGVAIHESAEQGLPGTCEEMIVKRVMDR